MHIPSRKFNFYGQLLALIVKNRIHWKIGERKLGVMRFLPTVFGNTLNEVTLLIKDSYCNQGHTEIASFFEIVPRKDPQTAGVDRQCLMKPEFSAKVGNWLVKPLWVVSCTPSIIPTSHIIIERLDHTIV